MPTLLILHGPNLNLLHRRPAAVYGGVSLEAILERCRVLANSHGWTTEHYQSNSEGALIDCIHDALGRVDGCIINAGGYSHTSVALRDAVELLTCPVIEIHLSNLAKRESFRHSSLLSAVCHGTITGLGPAGYELAVTALVQGMLR